MGEAGCQAVKLEGGIEMSETVPFLTERAIPVLDHVGLMPQSVNVAGGYRARGRAASQAKRTLEDARPTAERGAVPNVVEDPREALSRDIQSTVLSPHTRLGHPEQA